MRIWINNFNYLTGKQCQAIAVKRCSSGSANAYQKREIPLCPYWRVENEIIVFLTNEGLNWECCHGNKIFYFSELLSSCFVSVPGFTWFWPATSERRSSLYPVFLIPEFDCKYFCHASYSRYRCVKISSHKITFIGLDDSKTMQESNTPQIFVYWCWFYNWGSEIFQCYNSV